MKSFLSFLYVTVTIPASSLLNISSYFNHKSINLCFNVFHNNCRLEHAYYYKKLVTEFFHTYIWEYVTKIIKSKIEDEIFFKLSFLIALYSCPSRVIDCNWSLQWEVMRKSGISSPKITILYIFFSLLGHVLLRTNTSLEQISNTLLANVRCGE